MDLLNGIFASLLGAFQATSTTMAAYGLPALGIAAVLYWYWQGGLALLAGQGSMSDALGSALLRILLIGIYLWFVLHWQVFWTAVIESMFAFSGAADVKGLLMQPGKVWELGQQVTGSLGKYDSFWRGLASTWHFTVNPTDGILFILALGSFFLMTVQFGMILLETNLAIAAGIILFPWSILRLTSFLGEAMLGWLAGCAVRLLVLSVLLAAAFPLFQVLTPNTGGTFVDPRSGVVFPAMAPGMGATFGMVAGALLFAFLVWTIPARAARLMAGPALALTGSDLVAGAMTTARFAMAATGVIRGTSQLLTRMR